MRLLVALALLAERVLLRLPLMHSQEWLCYSTFSATSLATEADLGAGSPRRVYSFLISVHHKTYLLWPCICRFSSKFALSAQACSRISQSGRNTKMT